MHDSNRDGLAKQSLVLHSAIGMNTGTGVFGSDDYGAGKTKLKATGVRAKMFDTGGRIYAQFGNRLGKAPRDHALGLDWRAIFGIGMNTGTGVAAPMPAIR
jgi:hypothetical protein